jgi:uncharacterized protein (UPF0332 family)
MNSVTMRLLKKAQKLLINASVSLSVGLYDDAGRNAYLSGYSAARAFLYEQQSKIFKSHMGVQSVFSQLIKDDPRFDPEMRAFLSQTYNLKQIADYEEGDGAEVTAERATAAIEKGKRFVSICETAIQTPRNGNHNKPSVKL